MNSISKNPKHIGFLGASLATTRTAIRLAQDLKKTKFTLFEKQEKTPKPEETRMGMMGIRNKDGDFALGGFISDLIAQHRDAVEDKNTQIVYGANIDPQSIHAHPEVQKAEQISGDFDFVVSGRGKRHSSEGLQTEDLTGLKYFAVCFTGMPVDIKSSYNMDDLKKTPHEQLKIDHDNKKNSTVVSGFIDTEARGGLNSNQLKKFAYELLRSKVPELPNLKKLDSARKKEVNSIVQNATGTTKGNQPELYSPKLFLARQGRIGENTFKVGDELVVHPIQRGNGVSEMINQSDALATEGIGKEMTFQAFENHLLGMARKSLSRDFADTLHDSKNFRTLSRSMKRDIFKALAEAYHDGKIPQRAENKDHTDMVRACYSMFDKILEDVFSSSGFSKDKIKFDVAVDIPEWRIPVSPVYSDEQVANIETFERNKGVNQENYLDFIDITSKFDKLELMTTGQGIKDIVDKFVASYDHENEKFSDEAYSQALQGFKDKWKIEDQKIQNIANYGHYGVAYM